MPTQKDPTIFGYQNFYSTTLTGDITSGTLTIGLATVPSPTSGILIIEPDSTSAREVILYTSKGASTITCPSDGRGWSGSSASAHLTGSTVIMASVDEYFEGLADGTLSTDPIRTAVISNHVVSGGIVAQSAGLVGTFSNIVFYLNGQRYSGSSIANKTYTASKDTYVDVTAASGGTVSVTYSEVANGAASPSLAANYVRIAKVITSGAAITSVVQSGYNDSLGNIIRPNGAVGSSNVDFDYVDAVLAASFTSAATNTWQDSGLKVTLPTPGKWLILAEIRTLGPSTASQYAVLRLYDQTAGAAITNSERIGSFAPASTPNREMTSFSMRVVTTTANTVIRVDIQPGGAYVCVMESDTQGRSHLAGLRLGN